MPARACRRTTRLTCPKASDAARQFGSQRDGARSSASARPARPPAPARAPRRQTAATLLRDRKSDGPGTAQRSVLDHRRRQGDAQLHLVQADLALALAHHTPISLDRQYAAPAIAWPLIAATTGSSSREDPQHRLTKARDERAHAVAIERHQLGQGQAGAEEAVVADEHRGASVAGVERVQQSVEQIEKVRAERVGLAAFHAQHGGSVRGSPVPFAPPLDRTSTARWSGPTPYSWGVPGPQDTTYPLPLHEAGRR